MTHSRFPVIADRSLNYTTSVPRLEGTLQIKSTSILVLFKLHIAGQHAHMFESDVPQPGAPHCDRCPPGCRTGTRLYISNTANNGLIFIHDMLILMELIRPPNASVSIYTISFHSTSELQIENQSSNV